MTNISQIHTTLASKQDAEQLAEKLLEEGLMACANIYEAQSLYQWDGRLVQEGEWILHCKTSLELVDALTSRLTVLHPYKVPCIIRQKVQCNQAYADWVKSVIVDPTSSKP